jgi:PST family polysaccharide transporter
MERSPVLEQSFATDHLVPDLKGRSVRGGAVTLASQAGRFVIQLGATAVLARLLAPEAFGLVAMVSAVIGFTAIFVDVGFTLAIVQRPQLARDQLSTFFWFHALIRVGLLLVAALLAPFVGWLYGEPRLLAITVALGIGYFLDGLGMQPKALLRRQMRFTALGAIDLISLVLGQVIGIALAAMGIGYWALVVIQLMASAIGSAQAWILCGWRPGRPARGTGLREFLRFGAGVTAFNVMNYFARNADNVLIGSLWGPGPLGLYSKAYQLMMLPLLQINMPMASVAVPVLSRLQGVPDTYRRFYKGSLRLVLYLTLPAIVGLFAVADEVVAIVLGPRWQPVGPIFRALALAALFQPLLQTLSWIYLSLGQTDRMIRWGLVSVPTILLSFALGSPWGPLGIATAYAVAVNLLVVPSVLMSTRGSPIAPRDIASALSRPLLLSAILGLVIFAIRAASGTRDPVLLVVTTTIGGVLALALTALISGRVRTDALEVVGLLRHLRAPAGGPTPA